MSAEKGIADLTLHNLEGTIPSFNVMARLINALSRLHSTDTTSSLLHTCILLTKRRCRSCQSRSCFSGGCRGVQGSCRCRVAGRLFRQGVGRLRPLGVRCQPLPFNQLRVCLSGPYQRLFLSLPTLSLPHACFSFVSLLLFIFHL